jgi:hypothetical protein
VPEFPWLNEVVSAATRVALPPNGVPNPKGVAQSKKEHSIINDMNHILVCRDDDLSRLYKNLIFI